MPAPRRAGDTGTRLAVRRCGRASALPSAGRPEGLPLRDIFVLFVFFAVAVIAVPASARAQAVPSPGVGQYLGRNIQDVRLDEEGRTLTDPVVVGLVETRVGEPLTMGRVRDTLDHLLGLGRYQDVRVLADRTEGGVVLTYSLVPAHTVQQVAFTGELGVAEGELRQVMSERFGALPPVSRLPDVVRAFQDVYRDRGYRSTRIEPRTTVQHAPEQTLVTFAIAAGPRTTVGHVRIDNATPEERAEIAGRADLEPGAPYDRRRIEDKLADWVGTMRGRGYYETRAVQTAEYSPDQRTADVRVEVERGPHVTVSFAGDPIPQKTRESLVAIRREGSVDEDILEDSQQAIKEYLQQQGYRDAAVEYVRQQQGNELTITFTVRRGPRFTVGQVQVEGNRGVPLAEIRPLVRLKPGEPFVQSAVDTAVGGILELYRSRGYTAAVIQPSLAVVPVGSDPTRREVAVRLDIAEGVPTLVDTVRFEGNAAIDIATLRAQVTSGPGRPFYEMQLVNDRDTLQLTYLNRGYQNAHVDVVPTFSPDRTKADILFTVVEGPLVRVDHVLIVGNHRTSSETIARELLLKPGEPLGYSDLLESQRRLTALGLFRRVRITELRHGSDPNRDVLVTVEEAPVTTLGWGGGLEGQARARRNAQGLAEDRIEIAPRGFFEIGRRNLWGKNRSVNLYSRVSLRSTDPSAEAAQAGEQGRYGFNEYRVVGTFREPRVLNTGADAVITGSTEQAVRSSFNFARRVARAEVARRLTPTLAVTGQYQFSRVRLFDEQYKPDEAVLVDRLFPRVRLSTFSATLIHDTRDDGIDPDRGTLSTVEGDLAARSVGSEVGFAKGTVQGFYFHRLLTPRRVVLAVGARLGIATGFRRQVPVVDDNGNPVLDPEGRPRVDVVQDLPASERFFAGGDTTVRGFALDRLGTQSTIGASGFPTGGNALMIYNAEVRFALVGPLGGVVFFDTGNVFARATDISVREMRESAGFGLRYRSPLGPIRVDLGFKLDRRTEIRERLAVLHISLGQAF